VQMTGVEQQLLTNDLLKKLVSNTGTGVATAVSLIGKEVRADSADAKLANGKAAWTYALDRTASDVKLEILDSKGRVVKSIAPADNKIGEHKLEWDGKGANGSTLPDGIYTLRITAKDTQGSTVATAIYADGLVTGVEQSGGQALLTINGAQVPWDKIISIHQPEQTASTTPSDATSTGSNSNTTPNNPDGTTPSQATT